jgi:hypothetical protein
VSRDNLLDIIGYVDATNVNRPVLAHEASNTAHIISVA